MQVILKEIDEIRGEIVIIVPSETFEEDIRQHTLEVTSTAEAAKGFRPGKKSVGEAGRIAENIRENVINHLMHEYFSKAFEQEGVQPLGRPAAGILTKDAGDDFIAVCEFEVLPKLQLPDLSKVVLYAPQVEITDADIDSAIDDERERRARYQEVRRPIREGDRITFTYVDNLKGERTFDAGSQELYVHLKPRYNTSEERVFTAYSKALIGAEPGDYRPVPRTHINEYRETPKGAVVEFFVLKIEEATVPALDAEFMAATHGIEDGDMQAFREAVRQDMMLGLAASTGKCAKQQLIDLFLSMYSVPMPDAVMRDELEKERAHMLHLTKNEHPDAPDGSLEQVFQNYPDKMFTEQAERNGMFNTVVANFINQLAFGPDPAMLQAKVEQSVRGSKNPEQAAKHLREDEDMMYALELQTLHEQATKYILGAVTYKPVPCSYREAMRGLFIPQTEPQIEDNA